MTPLSEDPRRLPVSGTSSFRRARWVHPDTHEISKLMPRNPPTRRDFVLVDGVRHEVLRCPVKWEGAQWQMTRGVKVKVAPL